MKYKSLLSAALILVMAFSVLALIQKQQEEQQALAKTVTTAKDLHGMQVLSILLNQPLQQFNIFTYLTTFNTQSTLQEKAPLPENATRTQIYSFIVENPGVQFRGVCSGLGLSIGVVQFHLAALEKSGFITSLRKGRYKRFFATHRFTRSQMEAIATLKLQTVKNILKALLDGKRVSHHNLALTVGISSQGLTWQMNQLRRTGLIREDRNGLNVTYTIQQTHIPLLNQAMTALHK